MKYVKTNANYVISLRKKNTLLTFLFLSRLWYHEKQDVAMKQKRISKRETPILCCFIVTIKQ